MEIAEETLKQLKEQVVAEFTRINGNLPQYMNLLPQMKLCCIQQTTGRRGIRWFTRGDVTVGQKRPDGRITAFSPYPYASTGTVVNLCILAKSVPVIWIES